MKTIMLSCALTLGVLAVAAEIRAEHQGIKTVVAAPDLPPPDCFPDCPPNS